MPWSYQKNECNKKIKFSVTNPIDTITRDITISMVEGLTCPNWRNMCGRGRYLGKYLELSLKKENG